MKNIFLCLTVVLLLTECNQKDDFPNPVDSSLSNNMFDGTPSFELIQGVWRYNARLTSNPYLLIGGTPINTLSINTNNNCKMELTDSIYNSNGSIWENHYVMYGGLNGCYYYLSGYYPNTYEYIDSTDAIRFNYDSYIVHYVSNDSLLIKYADYIDYYSKVVSTSNNTSSVSWRVDFNQNDLESNRVGIMIQYNSSTGVKKDTIPVIANNFAYSGSKIINTTTNLASMEISLIILPYNGIPIPTINKTFSINTKLVINGTGLTSKTGLHTFCYSPSLNCYPMDMIMWNTPTKLNQIIWE